MAEKSKKEVAEAVAQALKDQAKAADDSRIATEGSIKTQMELLKQEIRMADVINDQAKARKKLTELLKLHEDFQERAMTNSGSRKIRRNKKAAGSFRGRNRSCRTTCWCNEEGFCGKP